MCDGPNPSHEPCIQANKAGCVNNALSLKQIGRVQAVKEKKEQQHIIII